MTKDAFTREAERLKAHGWEIGEIIDFFNQVIDQNLKHTPQQKDHHQWLKQQKN